MGLLLGLLEWSTPALHADHILFCYRVMDVECGWPVFSRFVWGVFVSFEPSDFLSSVPHSHRSVKLVDCFLCCFSGLWVIMFFALWIVTEYFHE